MSSKRVRFITLAGVLFVVLLIGISILVAKISLETRRVNLPETPAGTTDAQSAASDTGFVIIEVTTDKVQDVIAAMQRSVSYARQIQTMNYYTEGSTVYTVEVYVLEDAKSMKISGAGHTKNIIIADGMLYIWEDGDKVYYEASLDASENENKLSDMYQMILTYEDVLAVDPANITYAGYVDYNDNDEMCVAVQYTTAQLNYLTTCYISVKSGLLVGVEQYDGTTPIYSMSASNYSDEFPDAARFNLPDGTNPLTGN